VALRHLSRTALAQLTLVFRKDGEDDTIRVVDWYHVPRIDDRIVLTDTEGVLQGTVESVDWIDGEYAYVVVR
jgi:hypothetical protein